MQDDLSLDYKLTLRVYGQSLNVITSHSYCIDDTPTGTSSPIGTLIVDIRTLTLKQLRPMIQYDRSGHMDKRSILFQEALFIMSRLPNYYNRPPNELNKYMFGFIKKDGRSDFRLIGVDSESSPIASLIGAVDFFDYDLCVVPLSQIQPS